MPSIKAVVAEAVKVAINSSKNKKRTTKRRTAENVTSIPFSVATTINQNKRRSMLKWTGFEEFGQIELTSATPSGTFVKIPLNPMLIADTRLQNMARNFMNFRFTKLHVTIQGTLPTSVGGSLIAAYCENPDYDLELNSAVKQAFALSGAVSKNLWTNLECECPIYDRQKWYRVDADSAEAMNTTQGAIFVVVQNPVAITGTQNCAIRVRYNIEFAGDAIQNDYALPTSIVMPSTTFTNSATTYPLYLSTFVTASPTLTLSANVTYISEEVFEYTYDTETLSFNSIMYAQSTVSGRPNGYVFAANPSDMKEGKYIEFPPVGQLSITLPVAGETVTLHPLQ